MAASSDDDSDEEPTDEQTDPRERLPTMRGRRDFEMDVLGWLLFIVLLVLMIPLLPAIVLGIALTKLLGMSGDQHLSWRRVGRRPA